MTEGEGTHELDLGREAVIGFLSKAAMMALGFVGVVVFARVLGPAELGAYYLVLTAGRILAQVPAGVGAALKKRVSEAGATPARYLGLGLLLESGLAVAVVVLALLVEPFVPGRLAVPNLPESLALVVLGLGTFKITNQVYAGIGYPGYASWFDTIRSGLTLALQVALLVLGWGAFGLVAGFGVAGLVAALGAWGASRVRPRLPDAETVRSTGAFARWSVPDALLSNVYQRVDVIVIGAIGTTVGVGFYETALRMVQPAAFFASSVSAPLLVKASGLSSLDRDVRFDLENAISYTGLLGVPLFFGALAMPETLMRTVFGPAFAPAWPALVGLGLALLLKTWGAPFTAITHGTDRIDRELRISVAVIVVHLPLAVDLGLEFGLGGIVAATVVGEALRLALYQRLAASQLQGVVLTRPMVSQVLAGVVMFVAVRAFTAAVPVTSWVALTAAVSLGAAVYFAALATVSGHFRETLRAVLGPMVPRPH